LGGIRASNVACWNGTNWLPLRKGTDDPVNTMVTLGNQLYVGGNFLNANGFPARRVARWDGTNWFALGNGVDFSPWAMTVFSNKVVAGGRAAGAAVTNPVARWTGTNWARLT